MTNQHHMPLLTDYTPFKMFIRILVLCGRLNILIFPDDSKLKYACEYSYITVHEYLAYAPFDLSTMRSDEAILGFHVS